MLRRTARGTALVTALVAAILAPLALAPSASAATATTRLCVASRPIVGQVTGGINVLDECSLSRDRVEGSVVLLADTAYLDVVASTITDGIRVLGGDLNLISSTVRVDPTELTVGIELQTSGTAYIQHSVVYGNIAGDISDTTPGSAGALKLLDSVVTAGGGETYGGVTLESRVLSPGAVPVATLSNDRVGALTLTQFATTIENTYVRYGATISGPLSLDMCNVHVAGPMFLANMGRSARAVLGGYADPAEPCGGGQKVRVDGNLRIYQNEGTVVLRHVSIGGNLMCEGNARRPILEDVTVTGVRSGQCV